MAELKNNPDSILLVSCYELGHQPAGIVMPKGFLLREGYQALAMDLSIERFLPEKATRAKFIGISVPMHTALRLGVRLAEDIRKSNPDCHICFYGLYATLNSDYLLKTVADSVIGGEYEQALLALIKAIDSGGPLDIKGVRTTKKVEDPVLERLDFPVPDRRGLPPFVKYAMLENREERQVAGYV